METEQDWPRLAQYVVSRRVELGYTRQLDLVHDSSLGLRTLGSIEIGERQKYNRSTLAALEQALEWEPGSIRSVLDGGDPTPTQSREIPGSSFAERERDLDAQAADIVAQIGELGEQLQDIYQRKQRRSHRDTA